MRGKKAKALRRLSRELSGKPADAPDKIQTVKTNRAGDSFLVNEGAARVYKLIKRVMR